MLLERLTSVAYCLKGVAMNRVLKGGNRVVRDVMLKEQSWCRAVHDAMLKETSWCSRTLMGAYRTSAAAAVAPH